MNHKRKQQIWKWFVSFIAIAMVLALFLPFLN